MKAKLTFLIALSVLAIAVQGRARGQTPPLDQPSPAAAGDADDVNLQWENVLFDARGRASLNQLWGGGLPAQYVYDPVTLHPEEFVIPGRNLQFIQGRNLVVQNPVERVEIYSFVADTYGNPLGVEVAPLGDTLRSQLQLDDAAGVVVTAITPESAAAEAGLKQHDIVVKIGDEMVTAPERFHALVESERGKKATFSVLRKGKSLSLEITLPAPEKYKVLRTAQRELEFVWAGGEERYRVGVVLSEADETLRSQLRLAEGEGLIVTEVLAGTPAEKAGVRVHDVFIKLDGKRLTTVDAINEQIQEIKDREVTLDLLRAGEEISLQLAPRLTQEGGYNPLYSVAVDNVANFRNMRVYNVEEVQVNLHDPVNSAAQIKRLKRQLAAMQQTITALEASLAPQEDAAPAEGESEPAAEGDANGEKSDE